MAIHLNGSSQFGENTSFNGLPSGAIPCTFLARFNADLLSAPQQVAIGVGREVQTTSGYLELMLLSSGNVRTRLRSGGGTVQDADTANSIAAGGWHTAAAVFASNTDRRSYLDDDVANRGSNTAASNNTIGNTPDTVKVGKRPTGAAEDFWDGPLADLWIANAAWTEDELVAFARGVDPMLIRPASIVDGWRILDGSGQSVKGRFPLTWQNSPTKALSRPRVYLPARAPLLRAAPAGYTGTSAVTLGAVIAAGVGAHGVAGTAASTLPALATAAVGDHTPPAVIDIGNRGLTTTFVAETLAPALHPVGLVEVETATGVLRFWTGAGTLLWDEKEWFGTGTLLGVSEVQETSEVQATGAAFTLSAVPQEIIAAVLDELRQNKPVRYWLAMVADDGTVVADPYLVFDGRLDVPEIQLAAETAVVGITAESRLIDLERPRERRYTPEDQHIEYPDDRGFDYVASLQDAVISWGKN